MAELPSEGLSFPDVTGEEGDTSSTTRSVHALLRQLDRELREERQAREALESRIVSCEKKVEFQRLFQEDHSQRFAAQLGAAVKDIVSDSEKATRVAVDAQAIAKAVGERVDRFVALSSGAVAALRAEVRGAELLAPEIGRGPRDEAVQDASNASTATTVVPDKTGSGPDHTPSKALDEQGDVLPRDKILHQIGALFIMAVENRHTARKEAPRTTPESSPRAYKKTLGDGNRALCGADSEHSAVTSSAVSRGGSTATLAPCPLAWVHTASGAHIASSAMTPIGHRVGAALHNDTKGTAVGSPVASFKTRWIASQVPHRSPSNACAPAGPGAPPVMGGPTTSYSNLVPQKLAPAVLCRSTGTLFTGTTAALDGANTAVDTAKAGRRPLWPSTPRQWSQVAPTSS